MTKHLSSQAAQVIAQDYLDGKTMQQLAEEHGRTRAAISKLLSRMKVPARGKRECQVAHLPGSMLPFALDKTPPASPCYPPVVGQVGAITVAVADPLLWNIRSIMSRLGIPRSEASKHMLGLKAEVSARGQQLLLLWADEVNRPCLQSMLQHKASRGSTVCYARQTEVVDVARGVAGPFYDKYHLQGDPRSGSTLGLVHEGELVACMSFNYGNTCRGDASATLLSRFAVAGGVPGAASKLLSHYRRSNPGIPILSYSDERYAPTGALYKTLGFRRVQSYKPDYRYWRGGRWYAKSSKQKKQLRREHELLGRPVLEDKEFAMAERLGYLRCYDCGKLTWRLDP